MPLELAVTTHIRGANYRRYLKRPWWRRHLGGLTCTAILAVAVLLAHLGGH